MVRKSRRSPRSRPESPTFLQRPGRGLLSATFLSGLGPWSWCPPWEHRQSREPRPARVQPWSHLSMTCFKVIRQLLGQIPPGTSAGNLSTVCASLVRLLRCWEVPGRVSEPGQGWRLWEREQRSHTGRRRSDGPQGRSTATLPWSSPGWSYSHPFVATASDFSLFPRREVLPDIPTYLPSTLAPNGTSLHAVTTDSTIRLIGDQPWNKPVLTHD